MPTLGKDEERKFEKASKEIAEFGLLFVKKRTTFLYGLFVPPPCWPPPSPSVGQIAQQALPGLVLLGLVVTLVVGVVVIVLLFLPLLVPIGLLSLPLIIAGGYLTLTAFTDAQQRHQSILQAAEDAAKKVQDWRQEPAAFFSTATRFSQQRRHSVAADLISNHVDADRATAFNDHVKNAKGLAAYGCGVVAAAHVGALR